ncbi:methionine aminopeptidase [Candidatus Dependentiae bacterium Noda2021]|nr:methionine aminopeptidase [Candidatus Dependentiae bacterium Noda2021]
MVMITIKNKDSIEKMSRAGSLLLEVFDAIKPIIKPGISTEAIDTFIEDELKKRDLVSKCKGYHGYRHVSCISVNDVVVHGVPSPNTLLKNGDLVKVDICVSWNGYCADMARPYVVGVVSDATKKFIAVAQQALDRGIEKARAGNHLTDISAAIQKEVESNGYGVVRDFAGHGIGKQMHEDPEILNYGKPGKGPILRPGMTFAIEPMITFGKYDVFITDDGWTVKTSDKSLAMHVEDTVLITDSDPVILTRRTIE